MKGFDARGMAVLAFGHVFNDCNQSFLPALLPFLVTQRHYTNEAAAFLILAASVSSSVVQPAVGYLSDKRSMPWLIPLGMMLAATGMAFAGVVPSYAGIVAAVVLSGIGVAAFHPDAARYANYVAGPKKATGMSYFSLGGQSGFTLGPLFATPLLLAFGPRGTIFAIIPALIMGTIIFRELPRLRTFAPAVRRKGSDPARRDAWRPFGLLTAMIIVRSLAFVGLLTFIPLYLVGIIHATPAQANIGLACFLGCGAIGTLAGGRLADRFGRRAVLNVALVAMVAFVLTFVHFTMHGAPLLFCYAGVALMGFVLVGMQTVTVVLGQEYLPNHLGVSTGVTLGLAISVGGAFAPILGHIGDRYGLVTTMDVIAVCCAVAAILSFPLPQPQARRAAATLVDTAPIGS